MSKTSEPPPIRTFIAIAVPEWLRRRLADVQRDADSQPALRWVDPRQIHITVRFLGDVAADHIDRVTAAVEESSRAARPFNLTLSGLGAFPNGRAPRVLWAGLVEDEGMASMRGLFRGVEDALVRRGFPPEERDFSPHITLARTRRDASPVDRRTIGVMLEHMKSSHDVSGSFNVDSLIVMRSELGRAGSTYTPLAIVPLGPESQEKGGTLEWPASR